MDPKKKTTNKRTTSKKTDTDRVGIRFPSENFRQMSWTPDGSQPILQICAEHGVQMTQWAGKVCCGVCMRDRADRWEKMAEALYHDFATMCVEFGIKRPVSLGFYEQRIVDEHRQARGE